MAVIVEVLYLFVSFVVWHAAAAEANETVVTEVNIKSKCQGDVGFKSVNISWESLSKHFTSSNVTTYSVKYCTSGRPCESTTTGSLYKHGCTLNTTLLQKQLQCRIIAKSLFPFQFYYTVEMQTASGVLISNRKHCRLLANTQCTRPHNITVTAEGRRTLIVSWEPPQYMGELVNLLCYRIWYAAAQASTNESVPVPELDGPSQLSKSFSDLYPYTEYTFYIQCSLADCQHGWGLLDGPVTGRTNEEVPAKAPSFKNWSFSNISNDKRDVTVVWKLPPSNTWHGVPRRFSIDYWQVLSDENGSSIAVPNSTRNLQIDDGSVTEATLFGLSRFADYNTQISMCTTKGCGPRSVPLPFPGDKKLKSQEVTDASTDNYSTTILIVAGTVAGVSILIFIILILVLAARRHRLNRERRQHQPPLGEMLQLPDPVYGTVEDSPTHSYDELQLADVNDPNQENGPLCGSQGKAHSSRGHSYDEKQHHEPHEDLHTALVHTPQDIDDLVTIQHC